MNCFKKNSGFVTPMRSLVASSKASFLLVLMFLLAFSACTDYEAQIDDEYEEWLGQKAKESKYGRLTDYRDGQAYKIVKIGSQTWMAENLNYETDGSYCYNDDSTKCSKYGRLYTWAAAMDSAGIWSTNGKGCGYDKTCSSTDPVRGVCPEGWHLPSTDEWKILFTAVSLTTGNVLKSISGWNSRGNGTDDFGFSALPAGYRNIEGVYYDEGIYAYFWSSSEVSSSYAYRMYLYYDSSPATLGSVSKGGGVNDGISVRCLKDEYDIDYSSSSDVKLLSSSSSDIDCSVTDGVKVFYPKGGEKFKMGDTITVIYGSDVKGSGYRFVFKTSESDAGLDMLEESAGPSNPDGKTCYEQKVYLTDDFAEPTETALIRVIPYERSSKGANSGTFSVRKITDSKVSSTIGDMTDSRDGHTYKTMTIGSQTWMAENLNYEIDNSYCYNDSVEYCDKYGRLYTWTTAVGKSESECGFENTCSLPSGNIQGICPEGWHLPSNDEWRTLFAAVGGGFMGKVIKSTSGWYDDGNGTDSFGFSALPAGGWDGGELYYYEGRAANFWSSTEDSLTTTAYYIYLSYDFDGARFYGSNKYFAFSVRCLQD